MRSLAAQFENRSATIVLKGKQTLQRWIAGVQEDRIITYPVNAPHTAKSSDDRVDREVYRYSQIESIREIDAPRAVPVAAATGEHFRDDHPAEVAAVGEES